VLLLTHEEALAGGSWLGCPSHEHNASSQVVCKCNAHRVSRLIATQLNDAVVAPTTGHGVGCFCSGVVRCSHILVGRCSLLSPPSRQRQPRRRFALLRTFGLTLTLDRPVAVVPCASFCLLSLFLSPSPANFLTNLD